MFTAGDCRLSCLAVPRYAAGKGSGNFCAWTNRISSLIIFIYCWVLSGSVTEVVFENGKHSEGEDVEYPLINKSPPLKEISLYCTKHQHLIHFISRYDLNLFPLNQLCQGEGVGAIQIMWFQVISGIPF